MIDWFLSFFMCSGVLDSSALLLSYTILPLT